jgi:putative ABC transport system permease protein
MEGFSQDLRYALRQLWAARGLTALAVLTLALGIGSNTALFTVVESVLMRPLPYAHADRLAYIGPRQDTPSFSSTSWLNYRDIRDQSQTFEAIAAYIPDLSVLQDPQGSKSVVAVRVTPNLFSVLGVHPLLGRVFTPAEGQTDGPQAALLSEGLWRQDFHADPSIVGRTAKIGGIPRTIVGVMPADLHFPEADGAAMGSSLWLPLQQTATMLNTRDWSFIGIVGELRTGVTVAQAQSELDAIAGRIRHNNSGSTLKLQATAYQDLVTAPVRPAFYALLGAVALVLLIACTNVANLLIARYLGRQGEFAVRVALGAGRSRLVRQSLTEGALLSILGCIGGFILAALALTLVHKMPGEVIPRSYSIGMHWTVLLALAAIATLTTVLSSLLPALLAARTDPQAVLQAASRGLGSRSGGSGLSRWLVIGEVALSSLLLIGTGLLFHTLWNLEHADLGFDASRVTTFTAMPPDSAGFSNMTTSTDTAHAPTSVAQLVYAPVLARMRTEPGVQSAALITETPFSGAHVNTGFEILNQPKDPAGRHAQLTAVSSDYARTMGIATLRGRMVGDGDTAGAPYVVVINQTLAKKYFPNKDPLGQQLDIGGKDTGMLRPYTVVGVLADQAESEVGGSIDPLLLVPYGQVPTTSLFYQALLQTMVSFVVKTGTDAPAVPEIRAAFHQVAPGFALDEFQTMQKLVDTSIFSQRLSLYLTAAFAGLAILMVVAGLYGVLAQLVSYRRHEIGIRMALGATRESMARLILRQGSILIGTGLAIGLGLSLLLGQLVKSFLYHVPVIDAWTYAGVILLSLLVGLVASFIPAYRAASIEPMEALREQ